MLLIDPKNQNKFITSCPVAIEPAALAVLEVFTDEIVPIEAHLADLEAHAAKRRRAPS